MAEIPTARLIDGWPSTASTIEAVASNAATTDDHTSLLNISLSSQHLHARRQSG